MVDPRFFDNEGPFPLRHLAALVDAELQGADPDLVIEDVAPLDAASANEVTFLDNPKYASSAASTRAGACVISAERASLLPDGTAKLVVVDPYRAWARIAAAFYPGAAAAADSAYGRTEGAHVDPEAVLGDGVLVEPGAVVQAGASLADRVRVAANAVVGRGVVLGEDTAIGPGATVTHCLIGARVTIHAGVRIGQDGFGFALHRDGHLKVPQLGRVIVEDDVEIGANTTIDRGSGPDTVIGQGCKIDNLVMIAHNVVLGANCVIVAQSGISGSTTVGAGSVLAAQTGVTGHLTIGPGVTLAARSAVIRDLDGGQAYGGAPAIPVAAWRRQLAAISRLGKRKDGVR